MNRRIIALDAMLQRKKYFSTLLLYKFQKNIYFDEAMSSRACACYQEYVLRLEISLFPLRVDREVSDFYSLKSIHVPSYAFCVLGLRSLF